VRAEAALGAATDVEAVYTRIAARIMPVLILLFVIAWMDRVNVGFAKLQMLADRGFSEAVFGFGAGVFYLGYLLFEIPSNLVMERIGARKTLARIACSGRCQYRDDVREDGDAVLRPAFMLGVFEAGLYPGSFST